MCHPVFIGEIFPHKFAFFCILAIVFAYLNQVKFFRWLFVVRHCIQLLKHAFLVYVRLEICSTLEDRQMVWYSQIADFLLPPSLCLFGSSTLNFPSASVNNRIWLIWIFEVHSLQIEVSTSSFSSIKQHLTRVLAGWHLWLLLKKIRYSLVSN